MSMSNSRMSDSCDGSAEANVNVADDIRVGRRSNVSTYVSSKYIQKCVTGHCVVVLDIFLRNVKCLM